MKIFFGALIVSSFLLVSAHASDDCNSLLSDRLASSIHDLAKLRYDLDIKIAAGDSRVFVRSLESSFEEKKIEILAASNMTLSSATLELKLKEEVLKIQAAGNLTQALIDQGKQAEATILLDSITGISTIGQMSVARLGASVTVLPNDQVLILGGCDPKSKYLNAVEIYNPKTLKTKKIGKLHHPRTNFEKIVLSDSKVIIMGGFRKDGTIIPIGMSEVIDPIRRTVEMIDLSWMTCATEVLKVSDHQVIGLGTMYQTLVYDFGKEKVKLLGALDWSKHYSAASHLENGDLVITAKKAYYLFDEVKKSAREIIKMAEPRIRHGQVTLSNGQILIAGGELSNGNATSSIELFDATTESATVVGQLKHARKNPSVVALSDGRAVVFGGVDQAGRVVHAVEVFDPAAGGSVLMGELKDHLNPEFPYVLLSNDEILIFGGSGTIEIEKIKAGRL